MLNEIDAEPLEGWVIAEQAAEILGLTKQAVHNMMYAGRFTTIKYVGYKPTYLLPEKEVRQLKAERDAEARQRAQSRS